ncbi:hypothetical protein ABIB14_003292 [Arthrobacter sp. UYEF3]
MVKRYTECVETANARVRQIRAVYGYREYAGAAAGELAEFLFSRAWTQGESPTVLFEHATAWLRRERVLLPGVTTLVRVVQFSREQAQARMHGLVAAAAERTGPGLPPALRGLLGTDQGEQVSRLELLRAGPTRVSGPELEKALDRLAAIRAVGAGAVNLSVVPAVRVRVRALARHGLGAKAQSLRRLAEPCRTVCSPRRFRGVLPSRWAAGAGRLGGTGRAAGPARGPA